MSLFAFAIAASLVACSSPVGSFKGKLVNGATGQPLASVVVQMKASPLPPDRACHVFEATTGADGSFEVTGLCDKVDYQLSTKVETYMFEDEYKAKGGVPATASVDIKTWPVPKDNGVYLLAGEELTDLVPRTQVQYYQIKDSKEEVRAPVTMPENPPAVTEGAYLVLAGKRTIDEMHFYPILESGPRKFGPAEDPKSSVAWAYIGMKFASDTEFERVEVKPAEGKFIDLKGVSAKGEKRTVRMVPANAFEPAWYSVMGEKAFKTYVINFGNGTPPKVDSE